jgi:hypothetical protein
MSSGGKGNKHGGRKTRIKDYDKTKHARIAKANRKKRAKKAWGE